MSTATTNDHQAGPSDSVTLTVSERTPLISRASSSSSATASVISASENDETPKFKEEDVDTMKMFFQECWTIAGFAIPVFGSQILEYSLVFVSVFTLGHLSTTALAAISLATMTTGVTGMSIIHGFSSSLDTLLPPAWTSEQPGMMRVWVQRAAVGIGIQILMIWTLWWNAESILLKLRQDPQVARLAAQYLKVECVGLPAFAISTTMRRWFSAQELFSVPTRLIMIISPVNVAINYALVFGPPFGLFPSLKLGFIGAPISTATCQWLLMILNVIYAYNWVDRRGWYGVDDTEITSTGNEDIDTLKTGKDKTRKIGYGKGKGFYGWCFDEAFDPEGLLTVMRLGLSGIGQLVTEWWAWEVLVLAASQLGPISLAAQSALGTTAGMMFQPALGVAIATPMRIGNLMGEKNARRAGVAASAAVLLTFIASIATSLILIIFRNSWGRMFSGDETVNSIIASILPIIAFFQICDGNAAVTGGIMRAKAQQYIGAMLNITGYWMIALPIGGYLGFKTTLGLKGLWIGYTICLFYTSVVGSWLAYRTDWAKETRRVMERLEKEKGREAAIEEAREENSHGDTV